MISRLTKEKIYILVGFFVGAFIVGLSISYYTVYQFVVAGDRTFYGKKQSELAQEIRDELLKRKDVQVVTFQSTDDIQLQGFFFKREKAVANMVLSHGYLGSKEFMYGFVRMFPDINILMYDFRAHGQSSGRFTSIGCHEYKDVISAAHFLKENTSKELPMILLGISMGGASSIKAAEQSPGLCDALIIDSTYSDLESMFLRGFSLKVRLPYYPFFPLVKTVFHYTANCDVTSMSPVECVKKIKEPILFITSCNDEFIKPKNSLQLYTFAQNKKTQLWIGPKCRHGWLHTYFAEFYKKKVNKFLKETVFK